MRSLIVFRPVAVALLLLAVTTSTSVAAFITPRRHAGPVLPTRSVGSDAFLRLVDRPGEPRTVVLTARGRHALGARARGREIALDCGTLRGSGAGLHPGDVTTSSGGGRPFRPDVVPGSDICAARLFHSDPSHPLKAPGGPTFDTLALTRRGADFLAQDDAITQLEALFGALESAPGGTARRATLADDLASQSARRIVRLRSPTAPLAPGTIGIFLSGSRVRVAARTRLGERLWLDQTGELFSTDAEPHLARLLDRETDSLRAPALTAAVL